MMVPELLRKVQENWLMLRTTVFLVLYLTSVGLTAADYPDMVGVWRADLRTISSGAPEVATGGMVISEVKATVTVDHQDGEAFLGKVRLSSMGKNDPSVKMWGAIRSNGKEARFIGSDGTGGPIWFIDETSYEFCVTSLTDESVMMAYCGVFKKDTPQE